MDTPTQDQLRTLFKRVEGHLALLRTHLSNLQRDTETTRNSIIALQGAHAALQVALGDPYDPATVPMDLDVL